MQIAPMSGSMELSDATKDLTVGEDAGLADEGLQSFVSEVCNAPGERRGHADISQDGGHADGSQKRDEGDEPAARITPPAFIEQASRGELCETKEESVETGHGDKGGRGARPEPPSGAPRPGVDSDDGDALASESAFGGEKGPEQGGEASPVRYLSARGALCEEAQTPKISIEDGKPKFVFGSAAKSITSFTAVASTNVRADFGLAIKEDRDDGCEGGEDEEDEDDVSNSSPFDEAISEAAHSGNRLFGSALPPLADPGKGSSTATGEEGEETKFSSRVKLFELDAEDREWKEKGLGVLKVNESMSTGEGRIIMRSEGVLRVLVNIRLFPGMKYELVQERSIRFSGIVEKAIAHYLVRFRSAEEVQQFLIELGTYCDSEAPP